MTGSYLKQKFAATALALLGLALLSGYESARHAGVEDGTRRLSGLINSRQNLYSERASSLERSLVKSGDSLAARQLSGSAKSVNQVRDDIQSWYRLRAGLAGAEEGKRLAGELKSEADKVGGTAGKLSVYHKWKLAANILLLLASLAAFFAVNIDRQFKWLLVKSAGLAFLLFAASIGLLEAEVSWLDIRPVNVKDWFTGLSIIALYAIAWYGQKKALAAGAARPLPARFISADLLRMTRLAAPVLFVPHALLVLLFFISVLGPVDTGNIAEWTLVAGCCCAVLAFIALPIRIKRAAGKFDSH